MTNTDHDALSTTTHRGWRKAVFAASIVAGFVLIINIVFIIVASAKWPADDGVGIIYTGNCDTVARWDTALHLLINVLGTCLLAASSFTMQCLSSPTRSETDAAHAKRTSLEIGLTSFTNLWYLARWKGILWWALCLSTIPLHLLWNSTIFSTIGANEVSYLVANENFLQGKTYYPPDQDRCASVGMSMSNFTVESYLNFYVEDRYEKLSPEDCIKRYSPDWITGRKNFIAITKANSNLRMSPACAFNNYNFTVPNNSYTVLSNWDEAMPDYNQPLANSSSIYAFYDIPPRQQTNWLCLGYDSWTYPEDPYITPGCSATIGQKLLATNGTLYLRPVEVGNYEQLTQTYPIDYCLSEIDTIQKCQLQYVSYIVFVVIFCNLVKLSAMGAAAFYLWDLNEPILATVGDAVSSFMMKPDEHTEGRGIMDRGEIWLWQQKIPTKEGGQIYQRPRTVRLYQATSGIRWWLSILLCSLYLVVGCVLLDLGISKSSNTGYNTGSVWKVGLGEINESMTIGLSGTSTKGLLTGVLVANSFQLALSTTYFLYNTLYTAQCAAIEWASYAQGKPKALRVTWPKGNQRSTYYLQLPYHYGVPLVAFLILMHFLISQSIFLARIQWYIKDEKDVYGVLSDVGFSPRAILCTVCVGAMLIVAQIINTLRPLNNRIPIHANNSVIISAMCHCTDDEKTARRTQDSGDDLTYVASHEPVMWGVVSEHRVDQEFTYGNLEFHSDFENTFENSYEATFENGYKHDFRNEIFDTTSAVNNKEMHDEAREHSGLQGNFFIDCIPRRDKVIEEEIEDGWGGHCSFTAKKVELPVRGRRYY